MKRKWLLCLIPLGIFALYMTLALTAPLRMTSLDRRLDRLGLRNNLHSVEDLITADSVETVFVARPVGETVLGSGTWNPKNTYMVWRTENAKTVYDVQYADTPVQVEQVIKGDPALEGTVVTVRELLLEERRGRYLASRMRSEPIDCAVFCTTRVESEYLLEIPEVCILPIDKTDALKIWETLENGEKYPDLTAFNAMAREKLGRYYRVDLGAVDRLATAEELAALKALFEQPEYNAFVRARSMAYNSPHSSEYKQLTDDLIRGMLTLRLAPWAETDLTETEYDAYEAETGERPESLWRFRIEDALAEDSELLNIAGTAADAQIGTWVDLSRQLQEYPFCYLIRIPGEETYCWFAPDDSEIQTIEPISAAFHAQQGQRYLECELQYNCWVESAGRKLTYGISCRLDRAGGCPVVSVYNMQLLAGIPE